MRGRPRHWAYCDALAAACPGARVERAPIYVRDGRMWTSAGVTAGIDLALALVEEDLGRAVALRVARWLIGAAEHLPQDRHKCAGGVV